MAAKETEMQATQDGEAPEGPTSRVGWILGWVVTPGVLLGGLFLGGVYVGANAEDSWMTRAVMWLFG